MDTNMIIMDGHKYEYYGWAQIWRQMDTNIKMMDGQKYFQLWFTFIEPSRANKREQASCSTSEADVSYLTVVCLFSYLKYLLNIFQNICSTRYVQTSQFYKTSVLDFLSYNLKSNLLISLIWCEMIFGYFLFQLLFPNSTSISLCKK